MKNFYISIFIVALFISSCSVEKNMKCADYSAPEYFYSVGENGVKCIPPFKDYKKINEKK